MKKYIYHTKSLFVFVIAALLLGCLNGYSQESKHEFSIGAGGVYSFLSYEFQNGYTDQEHGGVFGLRYSYYLSDNWSIGLGADYQFYKTIARSNYFEGSYNTTDFENESFEFRYSATGYRESQNLQYLNVPLTVQFETGDETRFYIAAGVKAGFAVNGEYETKINSLSTSGYYPQYNAELFGPAFMGFGSFGEVNPGEQELETEMAWSGTLETGVKQYIGDNTAFYIGLFLDYGFNSIAQSKEENIINYPSDEMPVNLQYNSVINSASTDDVKLIAYGVKMRFAFF